MTPFDEMKSFEDRQIRAVWDEGAEEWFFSVVDVVAALTESADPKQYVKRMRQRDDELNDRWGTICTPTEMIASDGKRYRTQAATMQGILRIIQSIPSKKAEPFKQWLAQVGAERIEETVDPELAIDRALETYQKKGYSEEWIHQRLLAIRIRNDLTAEWKERGVDKGKEFAILTDDITRAWSGMSTRQYKSFKGLQKQNLRDNMTDTELVLNMLAETSTTTISQSEKPQGFEQSRKVAERGGGVAAVARQALEAEAGHPVVTSMNARDFANLLGSVIVDVAKLEDAAADSFAKDPV